MSDPADWLPSLVRLEEYGGDWRQYIDAVYAVFERDFIQNLLLLQGKPVRYRWRDRGQDPPEQKASTFWHVVTAGGPDIDRLPDLRRCERIGWICAMIAAAGSGGVNAWVTDDRGERRVLIALPDFSHVVVLADRDSYVLLVTSYPIEEERRRQRFRAEFEAWTKGKRS
ncbi:MAG: hypothetical protein AB7R89_29230 [Dehalococcoidia bacterium]